jgi:hypothetical protein
MNRRFDGETYNLLTKVLARCIIQLGEVRISYPVKIEAMHLD